MQFDFTQILIMVLIGLLFFKETLLDWAGQKFGFKTPAQKTSDLGGETTTNAVIEAIESALDPLKGQVDLLGSNHIEHVQQGINKIIDGQQVLNQTLFELKTTLQNIEKYGIHCRK